MEDRRTRATHERIKDALLALLSRQRWGDVSVSALCREAGVTRTTFYRHFPNLTSVVDELVDDAFDASRSAAAGLAGTVLDHMELVASFADPAELVGHEGLLPACQRLADDPKYLPLLSDEALAEHVISRVYLIERDNMVPLMMELSGLTRREAELVYLRDLYGTFFMNRALGWRKDELWHRMHILLSRGALAQFDAMRDEEA